MRVCDLCYIVRILDSGPRGLVVHFGHEAWNMVLNMMVGIRLAATRASLEPMRNVEAYDFIMKEKFSILPKASNVVDKLSRYDYVSSTHLHIHSHAHLHTHLHSHTEGSCDQFPATGRCRAQCAS